MGGFRYGLCWKLRWRRRGRESRRCGWTERVGREGLFSLAPDFILVDSLQFVHIFETLPEQAVRRRKPGQAKKCADLLPCLLVQLLFVFLLYKLLRLPVGY